MMSVVFCPEGDTTSVRVNRVEKSLPPTQVR